MVKAQLDIGTNGGAQVDVVYAIDQTYLPLVQDKMGNDPFTTLRTEMTGKGLTVTDYNDGKYIGIEGRTSLDDAAKVTKLGKFVSVFSDLKISIDKENGTIEVAGKIDLNKIAEKMGATTLADSASSVQSEDMQLTISFPSPVTNHNADKTDDGGKRLTWILKTDNVNEIYASTKLAEGSVGSWPWIAFGIVAALAIATVLLLVIRKKKKNSDYV